MDKAQPHEVWEREFLGDVTTHGRVQDLPSRERLGTRLDKAVLCSGEGNRLDESAEWHVAWLAE